MSPKWPIFVLSETRSTSCCSVIQSSQPQMNSAMLVGCIVCFSCIFLNGVDGKFVSETSMSFFCHVRHRRAFTFAKNLYIWWHPLPSTRHHRSNDDCLEGKRENYHVCSVQYCVQQLCTVQCTHMNGPNSSLDWVLSHWAHFTVLRFIFVYVFHMHVYFVGL